MTTQRIKDSAIGLIVPLLLLAAWEILTRREIVPVQVLVPPGQVYATFLDMVRSGELPTGLKISLLRVGSGFVVGAGAGFLLGAAMGLSSTVAGYAGPLFNAMRQVPLLGWLVLYAGTLWYYVPRLARVSQNHFGQRVVGRPCQFSQGHGPPVRAQPCASAAKLQAVTPTITDRRTPSLSIIQPVNRNDSAAANCVIAASSPKRASFQPRSADISGFRIAITGRSIALKMPATQSSAKSVQARAGETLVAVLGSPPVITRTVTGSAGKASEPGSHEAGSK